MIEGNERWAAAEVEVRAIRERMLPEVRRALAELRAAWRAGRVSQLDVLAGQRAEFENIDRMLHVLGEYHQARVTCERLAGGFVAELR
jgi:outer membrane protein TolC